MNLNPMRSNMTELQLDDWCILFSYKTPVAAIDRQTGKPYKTSKYWSRTTSRHIAAYFTDECRKPEFYEIEEKPQEFFDGLLKGVK